MPYYDLATRVQAVILVSFGFATWQVSEWTGITARHIRNLYHRALELGWQPRGPNSKLLNSHLVDKCRPGRKKLLMPELEEQILTTVEKNRDGREKSVRQMGAGG